MSHPSQFTLLGKRRFLPFFVTQLLGAFNDNLFKQSLILAILFKLSLGDGDRSIWVNLCALLFILPFFLFSALGGQFGEVRQGRADPRDQAGRDRHHGGRRHRLRHQPPR